MPTIATKRPTIPEPCPVAAISVGSSPGSGAIDFSLKLDACRVSSLAQDLPRLEFFRDYGSVKEVYEGNFTTRAPLELLGKWATLRFLGRGGGSRAEFCGLITNEDRVMEGAEGARTGRQKWVAVSPFQLLLKASITGAFYDVGGAAVEGEVVDTFNLRDDEGRLTGNRSSSVVGTTFVFGGTSTWTRRQALAYLLTRYGGAFTWTATGDDELLDSAQDVLEVSRGQSVGSLVRSILSPQFGLDFVVERTGEGFELRAFSLAAEDQSYLGVKIPRNTRRIELSVGDRRNMPMAQFVRSIDQRFSRLLVRGGRVVVSLSLRAANGTLEGLWEAAAETAYKAGSGTPADHPAKHDQARYSADLQDVYQLFGAGSDFTLASVNAAIGLTADGEVSTTGAAHQNARRKTLHYLPAASRTEFEPPLAWVYDEIVERYVRVDKQGISVGLPDNEWGLRLIADPPHMLARNHWAGAAPSEFPPWFDWETLVVTIAVALDTRLTLEATRPGGDGTTLEVEVPGAELWLRAPGTVTGIDGDGQLVTTTALEELRNDRDKLAPIMASLRARYFEERARCRLSIEGYSPWAGMLGHMVSVVEQGGSSLDLGAPITAVDYRGGDSPQTTVRAGYAS